MHFVSSEKSPQSSSPSNQILIQNSKFKNLKKKVCLPQNHDCFMQVNVIGHMTCSGLLSHSCLIFSISFSVNSHPISSSPFASQST
jgi:hypothetical protein